jgi:uncharacterized protein (UPF0333 family)
VIAMKSSTKTLLTLAALGAGAYYLKKRSDAQTAAAAAAAQAASAAPALQTTSAATPAEVVADTTLAGSSLAVPTLASRSGMGVFG